MYTFLNKKPVHKRLTTSSSKTKKTFRTAKTFFSVNKKLLHYCFWNLVISFVLFEILQSNLYTYKQLK